MQLAGAWYESCFTRGMLRFVTTALGSFGNEASNIDARLLRDASGCYRVLSGTLGEAFTSAEAAREAFERSAGRPVTWRVDMQPRSSEQPCPICEAPLGFIARYPRRICAACELEACDAAGSAVRFGSASFGGGVVGWYVADGSRFAESRCFVRGVACEAQEGRFGGVLIEARLARQ